MQQQTRRSRKGFMQYLAAQTHRQDKVGVLARVWTTKRHWLLCLLFGPDAATLRTGAVKAMVEYDKQCARSRMVSKRQLKKKKVCTGNRAVATRIDAR